MAALPFAEIQKNRPRHNNRAEKIRFDLRAEILRGRVFDRRGIAVSLSNILPIAKRMTVGCENNPQGSDCY
jgi:hypothetical protein